MVRRKFGEYATNKLGLESLRLENNFSVVDIGCGTGSALRHASEKVANGVLIGIESILRVFEISREKTSHHLAADRVRYYEGSAENMPIRDSFADVVLAFDSYDHWQDQVEGLKEVRRSLKPNGLFVVVRDGYLPNEDGVKRGFLSDLMSAGFRVEKRSIVSEGGVDFSQWICVGES